MCAVIQVYDHRGHSYLHQQRSCEQSCSKENKPRTLWVSLNSPDKVPLDTPRTDATIRTSTICILSKPSENKITNGFHS